MRREKMTAKLAIMAFMICLCVTLFAFPAATPVVIALWAVTCITAFIVERR